MKKIIILFLAAFILGGAVWAFRAKSHNMVDAGIGSGSIIIPLGVKTTRCGQSAALVSPEYIPVPQELAEILSASDGELAKFLPGLTQTTYTISWGLTGDGCIDGSTHSGEGAGFLTKELVWEATWSVQYYKCSDSGCFHYESAIIPESLETCITTRMLEQKSCAE